MKQNWEYIKLSDICDVINGLWTGKKEPFINVAVIRNTNFSKDCRLKLDDVAYIDVEAKQFAKRKLLSGDIIIEKSGGTEKQPVGRAVLFNISEGEYSFSNFTATLRIKDDTSVNPQFLQKCLFAYYKNGKTLNMQSKTTGLHNLDMSAYLRLPIPIPSILEQEHIVAELDLLQGIIDKQKAQLKEYDILAQSIFYDMFGDPVENGKGWDVKKMGEICNSELGKMLDAKKNTGEYREYLCTINVLWGSFDLTTIKRMRIEDDDIARYSVQKGDLLICEGGDTGRCAIWNRDENLCYQNSLHRVRFYSNIMLATVAQFVFYIMKERGELDKYCKGQTIKHLVKCALLTIPIPIPPLQLQQQFAEKIEAIEKQKAAINKSLAETQKLFDYTMDKYFG